MMDKQKGNSSECYECGAIFEGEDDATMDCEDCGGELKLVNVTSCPVGPTRGIVNKTTGGKCDDENHHWGIGKHVVDA